MLRSSPAPFPRALQNPQMRLKAVCSPVQVLLAFQQSGRLQWDWGLLQAWPALLVFGEQDCAERKVSRSEPLPESWPQPNLPGRKPETRTSAFAEQHPQPPLALLLVRQRSNRSLAWPALRFRGRGCNVRCAAKPARVPAWAAITPRRHSICQGQGAAACDPRSRAAAGAVMLKTLAWLVRTLILLERGRPIFLQLFGHIQL